MNKMSMFDYNIWIENTRFAALHDVNVQINVDDVNKSVTIFKKDFTKSGFAKHKEGTDLNMSELIAIAYCRYYGYDYPELEPPVISVPTELDAVPDTMYYYTVAFTSDGVVVKSRTNSNSHEDDMFMNIGNYFHTYEEASDFADICERMLRVSKVRRASKLNLEIPINRDIKNKYTAISYNKEIYCWSTRTIDNYDANTIIFPGYFDNEQLANAIADYLNGDADEVKYKAKK